MVVQEPGRIDVLRIRRCMLRATILGAWLLVSGASADETWPALLQCGDDEREDAGGTCSNEPDFLAGQNSTALHLKVGGEARGCDSEWAASFEFDLASLRAGLQIFAATLIVRKTGYSDDSEGFTYVGAFDYAATGGPVAVPRAALAPETALDIVYPSAANTDLHFDVTAAVQTWVAAGASRTGLLLAGVYSEVGYETWISVGGANSYAPPRLVVQHEGSVARAAAPWSAVKSIYR